MKPIEYDTMYELEDTHWWYRALHAYIIHTLKQHFANNKVNILDLGCGTGGLMRKLSKTLPAAFMVGSDLVLECCRRTHLKAGISTVQSNANQMTFGANKFDAIIAADLIYHSNIDQKKALHEIKYALKSDGIAIINVPAYQWLSSTHDIHVEGARRYTISELKKLLIQNGFEVIFITYWNTFLFPFMVFSRIILGRFRAQSDLQKLPAFIDWLFDKILRLESQFFYRGYCFPFGGSVFTVIRKKANG